MVNLAVCILIIAANVFAGSGDRAYQAKKYLLQGRYGAAYGQYSLTKRQTWRRRVEF